jgi:hypothetical protein
MSISCEQGVFHPESYRESPYWWIERIQFMQKTYRKSENLPHIVVNFSDIQKGKITENGYGRKPVKAFSKSCISFWVTSEDARQFRCV